MRNICADAGFLIGVYDERDPHHQESVEYFVTLFDAEANRLLIPWPVLYEALSTRMARNVKGLRAMERDWKRLQTLSQLELIPDDPFREGVIEECFEELNKPQRHYRTLSAADRVVRKMLSDINLRVQGLITYNPQDFADICRRFDRQIYP
jgi:predicted nucleic acid-binding protein